jgi:hypothetical protein
MRKTSTRGKRENVDVDVALPVTDPRDDDEKEWHPEACAIAGTLSRKVKKVRQMLTKKGLWEKGKTCGVESGKSKTKTKRRNVRKRPD